MYVGTKNGAKERDRVERISKLIGDEIVEESILLSKITFKNFTFSIYLIEKRPLHASKFNYKSVLCDFP